MITCPHCKRIFSRVDWVELVLIGYFGTVFSGSQFRAVELRRCKCGRQFGVDTVTPMGVA